MVPQPVSGLRLTAVVLLTVGVCKLFQAATLYPVWWYQDLNLFNLQQISTRFNSPFTPRQERFLAAELARYGNDSSTPPSNCQSLLHEQEGEPIGEEGNEAFHQHTNTWGKLGVQCSLLAALRKARPARISYLHNIPWNQNISTLLPAGVGWANNPFMVQEAMKAEKQHKTLQQFRIKSKWITEDSILEEQDQDEADPPYGAFYEIAAKGDFNGDGIEDWIIQVTGATHKTGDRNFHLFLVTKRSPSSGMETVKRLF